MRLLGVFVGLSVIFIVLLDAFETIILPRRITHKLRLTRFFYRYSWRPWAFFARRMSTKKSREAYLGFYGPLSLLLLLALWVFGLVVSFALLHWSADAGGLDGSFWRNLYYSGTTFFTLGLGDVIPHSQPAKILTVAEAGLGLGLLAIVIGYLPIIYQAFSRRETSIVLLDARAGSPPTAGELLRRHSYEHGLDALTALLGDWERWSADLLESHISYPVLAYFRSQHNNQSWLAALTAILDTCALVMAGLEGACERQAELTFAIARHAVVDLSQVFGSAPLSAAEDRLPPDQLRRLRGFVESAGLRLSVGDGAARRLTDLRRMYEPYIESLAGYLLLPLPPWFNDAPRNDNWQTSAWEKIARPLRNMAEPPAGEDRLDDHL
jgi:ion channel